MKKIIVLVIIFTKFIFVANAQIKPSDFGKINLNVYISDKVVLTSDAKQSLETILNRIVSDNGVINSEANPRFIITAVINIGTKDIIAGPPQQIAENIELTLFIGDALKNIVFSNTVINIKGVGISENKALIDAIKNINPKNIQIETFLEEGKSKIITYYNSQCDFIIQQATLLSKQEKYDKAIYDLSQVPDACEDCYKKCITSITTIYQKKIDADCKAKFTKAKAVWASGQNSANAEKVGDIIKTISPMSSCQQEVSAFINNIKNKLHADAQARWQFKMKQYEDNVAMQKEYVKAAEEKSKRDDEYREKQSVRDAELQEKQAARNQELENIRINTFREVAVEYAKNQPKEVSYNNIYWR